MADNTTVLDPSVINASGDVIATDDIAGVKYQRVKFIHGNDGVNDGDVSSNNPLPISIVGDNPSGDPTAQKIDGQGVITTTNLNPSQSFDSTVLDLRGYTQVQTHIMSDQSGSLLIEFCSDAGGTVVRSLTIPYDSSKGFQMFSAPAFTPYVRYVYTNGTGGAQTTFFFETKFLTKPLSGQILGMDAFISSAMVGGLTRSVIVGQTDGGDYVNVPVTTEGHLEVAMHDPLLPFGSVHTESLTPLFQTDAVYGINTQQNIITTGLGYDPGPTLGSNSGSVTSENSMFKCSTGTTAFSFGSLQSRKRARYRAGQGMVGRFTALFPAPVANSILVGGFGSGEAGYFFGYNGTSFGILHSTGGVREIQTFTVSAATSSGGTVTFRLNGIDTEVTLSTSGTTIATANDIASQSFPGWTVEARGSTVIFLAGSSGNKTGTFSITLGTAVGTAGTFSETVSGVSATDVWIAQSNWNGDVCDGSGRSGFILDHTKGNVFQIGISWLGFGPVTFKIMVPNTEGNNSNWITVHTINNPNSRTTPHVNQPAFPFTASAYSAGSTTDVSILIGSYSAFIEGEILLTGPRSSFSNTSTLVSSGAYHTLFSIRNSLIHSHDIDPKANQSVINILSFGGAHDDATPIIFYLLRGAELSGPTNWLEWSDKSCIYYDIGSTTATISDNNQIVQAIPVGQSGTILISLEDTTTLQPGETLTVAAKTTTGTSTFTIATLNTREDQ